MTYALIAFSAVLIIFGFISVYNLGKNNDKLRLDILEKDRVIEARGDEIDNLETKIAQQNDELAHISRELVCAQKSLEMVLNDEMSGHFDEVAVEIGRDGMHYRFHNNDLIQQH